MKRSLLFISVFVFSGSLAHAYGPHKCVPSDVDPTYFSFTYLNDKEAAVPDVSDDALAKSKDKRKVLTYPTKNDCEKARALVAEVQSHEGTKVEVCGCEYSSPLILLGLPHATLPCYFFSQNGQVHINPNGGLKNQKDSADGINKKGELVFFNDKYHPRSVLSQCINALKKFNPKDGVPVEDAAKPAPATVEKQD
jgi:hypothetical protein